MSLNISTSNRKSTIIKRGIKQLGITNPGERFVLECIIQNHHMNNYIVKYIDKIKLEHGLIRVQMTTSRATQDFCVSNIDSEGFSKEMDMLDRRAYVRNDIAHKTV